MKTKYILASISLFCYQKNWPAVLRKIEDFNKTVYPKGVYCIEFNYLAGENIRFSLLIPESDIECVLKQVDHYFRIFFLKRNFDNYPNSASDGIFKSFKQNMIYYGLYKPIEINSNKKKSYSGQFVISKLIVRALKHEENLDHESILTLAYYFTVCVLKTSIKNSYVPHKVFSNYFNHRSGEIDTIEKKIIQAKFKENKCILLEISNSIGTQDAPDWIKDWENFIIKFLCNKDYPIAENRVFFLMAQINYRLGLSERMEKILNYFICCLLKKNTKSTTLCPAGK